MPALMLMLVGSAAAFDVMVIGGGAAGCASARVFAQAGLSTLLLERGPSEETIPAVQLQAGFSRDSFASEAYEAIQFKRGEFGGVARVLGGGTALNQGLWVEETDEFLAEFATHIGVDDTDFVSGMRASYDEVSDVLASPLPSTHEFAGPGQQAFVQATGRAPLNESRQLVENGT